MPRAGLTTSAVVATALSLADEVGFHNLTMGLLATRLGVRSPSLYKHVDGLDDLQHRLATLVTTQAADEIGAAVQGLAGRDALACTGQHDAGLRPGPPGRLHGNGRCPGQRRR